MAPGLRNTRVIHRHWESHHYPVAEGQMTAECVITREGHAASFDEVSGRSIRPTATTVYDNECRVQRSIDPPGNTASADRQVAIAEYVVTIPVGSGLVRIGDLVKVTACTGDPDLVGLTLTVTNVRRGSLTWQRDLVCQMQPPPTVR